MNIGTLRKILVTLGQILSYAVRHRYIDYNPLREAERPRRQPQIEEDEIEHEAMQILTSPQINAFLSLEHGAKYQILFTMAIFTGARQVELLGLKWSDVDWNNRQIFIQLTRPSAGWKIPSREEWCRN